MICTDHASLQYLCHQKEPTKCLICWLDKLVTIDAPITYKKSLELVVPDSLSHRPDLLPVAVLIMPTPDILDLTDWLLLVPAVLQNANMSQFPDCAVQEARHHKHLFHWDKDDEILTFVGKDHLESSPFIPKVHCADLLDSLHSKYGHQGSRALCDMHQGRGWWPHRQIDTDTYCTSCLQCQIFSSSRHTQELEELHPLSPCQPFEH